jgi:crotonobetainyl-CoA hydratase
MVEILNDEVRTERRGKVLLITLDRPPVNALANSTQTDLYKAFCLLKEDEDLVVGVLTNQGERVFSAGWDLKAVAAATDVDTLVGQVRPGGFAGIAEFWNLHKPVIAAVNGHAIGGGFELALACDIIVASDRAEFGLPEMQRGFLPDAGAIQRLPRRIPYNVAMELLLTGRRLSSQEGKRWGLIHEVVPSEEVLPFALQLAETIAKSAPLALQALKAVMPEIAEMSLPEAMTRMKKGRSRIAAYEKMMASDDFFEGPRAYVEKRPPQWKGR